VEFLVLVENTDKESRNDSGKAGACAVHAGVQLEAVRQVKAGQAIAVVAKVLGIPKASLGNWVTAGSQG
jgi:hypothetical protein